MSHSNLIDQPSTSPARSSSSDNPSARVRFVQKQLPWILAAGVFVVFLATLSTQITFKGAMPFARAVGWDWNPVLNSPLTFLLTYPFRWLPGGIQLIALNGFVALCGALTVALLARSVALLPHDRTRDQRQFERDDFAFLSIKACWLPPIFAALVCALQLTFWEHSIMFTGEIVDLLLFAYCIRCLLEYRVTERDSWISRMAFVYGLGITNNFAMIGFLPLFVGATAWIKGMSFLNKNFLLKTVAWGFAGLSLYLLLPIVNTASGVGAESFWEYLKTNLVYQKNMLKAFPRSALLLLSLTSIAPVIFMGVKWPASFGDINAAGNFLTNLMTHLIHAIFLVACLYVAFDPPFSPRSLGGGNFELLPLYYLGALSIGYFAGYFLLVFGSSVPLRAWQRPSALRKALNYGIVGAVCLAAVAAPAMLAVRNFKQVRANSSADLSRFGVLVAQSLPPTGGLLLSDDVFRLFSARVALSKTPYGDKYVLVDTGSLTKPGYHRYLHKTSGQRWPMLVADLPLNAGISPEFLIKIVQDLSKKAGVYYVHPSFGYYFETFYAKPQKAVYQLLPHSNEAITPPALTAAEMKEIDDFWQPARAQLEPVVKMLNPSKTAKKGTNPDRAAIWSGWIYSRAFDALGVEFQRAGNLPLAHTYFTWALELNPESAAAIVNKEFNERLQKGDRSPKEYSEAALRNIRLYAGNWNQLLSINGPVDEPASCFALAETFSRGRYFRQAAQNLERVIFFDPENWTARAGLASLCVQAGLGDLALKNLQDFRDRRRSEPLSLDEELTLLRTEAWAHNAKNDLAAAEKLLNEAQNKYPTNSTPSLTLAEIYRQRNQMKEAIAILEKQIKAQPGDFNALIEYSRLRILNGEHEAAIPYLNQVLTQQSLNVPALFNRAIAYLQSGKLDEALQDYEKLKGLLTQVPYTIYFGLGEIHWQKKNIQAAKEAYEMYLKVVPPGIQEVAIVQDRLQKLKESSR